MRLTVIGIVGIAAIGIGLYAAGFRLVGPNGQSLLSNAGPGTGMGQHQPGWRRAPGEQSGPTLTPGSGGRQRLAQGTDTGPGSQKGVRSGGRSAGRGQRGGQSKGQGGARQPGFGPSGGILLPSKVGTSAIPVMVSGQAKASFVGQDLVDHVEDTVVATADGPRKGWAIAKTLKYLGVENYKEVTLTSANGKKIAVTPQQLNDQQTIPLFTYNEAGLLMVVSGPKVRGTNKGNITIEDVKKTVAGRTDLLNVSKIEKIEVKG
ncbi:MAG: hypothetical protein HY208_00505 [Nitrospirae bacterium]|nr:hypothetical protein [Nitrospirota bacterium]